MGRQARVFLLLTVLSFGAAALRFFPGLATSSRVTDFATGLGVGLLIGVLASWNEGHAV